MGNPSGLKLNSQRDPLAYDASSNRQFSLMSPAHQARPVVAVVHQMARTGGTLVNRCLGSMTDVAVLSEVHPRDPQFKITRQASAWYRLLGEDDLPWLRAVSERPPSEAFAEIVVRLAERCEARGRHLVLRDWSHLDFLGVPFVKRPPLSLLTEAALTDRCRLRQAFVVRHPLDQYASSASRPGMAPQLTPQRFVAAYHAFAEVAAGRDFQRYEDLVAHPDEQLRRLCAQLQIPYDKSYQDRWRTYDKLTGDNVGPSRGFGLEEIGSLPPRKLEESILSALKREPGYRESLSLLGYENREA